MDDGGPSKPSDDEMRRWLPAAVMVVLHEGTSGVVDEVADRIRPASSGRHSAEPVILESTRFSAFVSEVVRMTAQKLLGRDVPGTYRRAIARDLGVDLVRDGASIDLVRESIHTTTAIAVDRLFGIVEGHHLTPTSADVQDTFRTIADCEFEMLRAFDEAMRALEDEEGTRRQRVRQSFLSGVMEGPLRDPLAVARRATDLDLDLTSPLGLVLLVEGTERSGSRETDESFEDRVMTCQRRPRPRLLPPVFVEPEPDEPMSAVLAVPAWREPLASEVLGELAEGCVEHGLVGVHGTAPELADSPFVYHQLRNSAPVLDRCARHVGILAHHVDLFPYRSFYGSPAREAEEIIRLEIGPLMRTARHAAERVETWKLLVRERLTDVEAAERLGIGVSALAKRRRTIEELLGHRIGENQFRAQAASYLFDLWEDDLPPAGDPWWSRPPTTMG